MKLLKKIEKTVEFISRKNFTSKKDPFLKSISKFLNELFDVSYVLINRYSIKKPDIVETIAIYSKGGFMPNLKYNLKFTPCENVIDNELCVYPKNVQEIFPKDDLLTQMDVDSYIGLPLWSSNGEPIGLIAILDKNQLKDTKTIEIILQIVAVKAAQELEKEIYENKLALQIQDLKVSKDILRKSEEKYSAVVENSNDGIVIHKEGKVVFANQVVEKVLGIKKNELIGKDILDFVSPDFHEAVIQRNLARYAGEKAPEITEIDLIRKDGTRLPVEINTSIFNYGGEKTSLIFIRNISERRIVENKLKESEEKFKKAFFNNPSPLYLTSIPEGRFIDVNPLFEKISGYSRKEVIGKTAIDLDFYINEQDRTKLFEELKNKGRLDKYELPFKVKNGKIIACLINSELIDMHGEKCLLSIVTDITEQKRVDEAFRESERKTKALLNATLDKAMLIDKDDKIIAVNKAMAKAFDKTPEELIDKKAFDLLPRELAKERKKKFEEAVKSGTVVRFVDHREDRWYDNSIYPIFDEKGKISQYAVFSHDITEKRKSEEKLKESEDRFHRFAEASTEGIAIAINGIIQDVNNRLTELTGYSKEELIDSPMLMIVHHDDQKLVVRNVKAGYEGTYEFRILKKDGNTLHVEAQGSEITYEGKNARISRIYDISERKRAEETLKSSEERLKIIFDSAPDAIYLTDLKGICIDANKVAENMLGYEKKEVIGKNLLKLNFLPVKEILKATVNLSKIYEVKVRVLMNIF